MEHRLRGEEFVLNKGWIKKYNNWCNEDGINVMVSIISNYTNKNTYLGCLRKEQIDKKCEMMKIKVAKLLFSNYKTYEIDKSKREVIITIIVNAIHSALTRSEDGKEGEQLSTATQRIENINNPQQQENVSMLRRIPFVGKWGR